MARTNAAVKGESVTVETTLDNNEVRDSLKACNKLIDAALKATTVFIQSAERYQAVLHEAMQSCFDHAQAYGDVRPMDRLIKGMPENVPSVRMYRDEMVAYLQDYSPIRWNAEGEPRQAKESDKDFKPYDSDTLEETPFFETDKVLAAREAAAAASRRALEPVDSSTVIKRILGVSKFVQNAQVADTNGEIRGIADGEEKKINAILKDVKEVLAKHTKDPAILKSIFANDGGQASKTVHAQKGHQPGVKEASQALIDKAEKKHKAA